MCHALPITQTLWTGCPAVYQLCSRAFLSLHKVPGLYLFLLQHLGWAERAREPRRKIGFLRFQPRLLPSAALGSAAYSLSVLHLALLTAR